MIAWGSIVAARPRAAQSRLRTFHGSATVRTRSLTTYVSVGHSPLCSMSNHPDSTSDQVRMRERNFIHTYVAAMANFADFA